MLYLGFNPNAICATVCGSQIKKTILYLEGWKIIYNFAK